MVPFTKKFFGSATDSHQSYPKQILGRNGPKCFLYCSRVPNWVYQPAPFPVFHTWATKLLFVIAGSIQVWFVDTSNKLFTQKLEKRMIGDMFRFPKAPFCGWN
uniref:Cupin type-1 domain-containing protein n=1 Tax=Lactuca sativa TaxID=4236 RepID=A0A9R1WB71_LACSA|nr:hypothetical protein LSAT_V11C200088960 [Lactuca sativa]